MLGSMGKQTEFIARTKCLAKVKATEPKDSIK